MRILLYSFFSGLSRERHRIFPMPDCTYSFDLVGKTSCEPFFGHKYTLMYARCFHFGALFYIPYRKNSLLSFIPLSFVYLLKCRT